MMKRYSFRLSQQLERDLEQSAKRLGVAKTEALRRAIMLLKHASKAAKVEVTPTDGGERQEILVK
jgi:predicted DNA-binding protein